MCKVRKFRKHRLSNLQITYNMTVNEYYREKTAFLRLKIDKEEAAAHARLLICHVLGFDSSTFFIHGNDELTDEQIEQTDALIQRRAVGEPLQYIVGKWGFMGLEFEVNGDCLIPRQDTETLVELAVERIKKRAYKSLLDMCCGSGCIGISLAKYTNIAVTSCDISEKALEITRKNAANNAARVCAVQSDMFEKVNESFDIITVNPPYLTAKDMQDLQKELLFEPSIALFGGEDGLKFYRCIASNYKRFLNAGGSLFMEIGATQGQKVCGMFENAKLHFDICGNARVVEVQKL